MGPPPRPRHVGTGSGRPHTLSVLIEFPPRPHGQGLIEGGGCPKRLGPAPRWAQPRGSAVLPWDQAAAGVQPGHPSSGSCVGHLGENTSQAPRVTPAMTPDLPHANCGSTSPWAASAQPKVMKKRGPVHSNWTPGPLGRHCPRRPDPNPRLRAERGPCPQPRAPSVPEWSQPWRAAASRQLLRSWSTAEMGLDSHVLPQGTGRAWLLALIGRKRTP